MVTVQCLHGDSVSMVTVQCLHGDSVSMMTVQGLHGDSVSMVTSSVLCVKHSAAWVTENPHLVTRYDGYREINGIF